MLGSCFVLKYSNYCSEIEIFLLVQQYKFGYKNRQIQFASVFSRK